MPFGKEFLATKNHLLGRPSDDALHAPMAHALEQTGDTAVHRIEFAAQTSQLDAEQTPELLQVGRLEYKNLVEAPPNGGHGVTVSQFLVCHGL